MSKPQQMILDLIATLRGSIQTGYQTFDLVVWFIIRVLFFITVMYGLYGWGEVVFNWLVSDVTWLIDSVQNSIDSLTGTTSPPPEVTVDVPPVS